jgi:signal transduction histidine kinase
MFTSDLQSNAWREQPVARIVAGVLVVLYFASIANDREVRGDAGAAAVVFGAALVLSWVLLTKPGQATAALGIMTVASLGMGWVAPHSAGGAPIYVVVASAAARFDLRRGVAITVGLALAELAEQQLRAPIGNSFAVVAQSLAVGLVFLWAYSVRRGREQQQRTREARFETERAQERARLAREIHDVLAHSLTALTIQLDLAEALLKRDPTDAQALATVERARSLARQGLDEARRAVGALRGDDAPGPDQLPRLAEQFETDTGVDCKVAVAPTLPELSSDERVAIYRVAQEALTNVRKHAAARRVVMSVASDDGGVALTVENDGGTKPSVHSGGFGLTGMRERAELLGGRLEAGPTADGYRVRLWLPV